LCNSSGGPTLQELDDRVDTTGRVRNEWDAMSVKTTNGLVRGSVHDGVHRFLSIPYAAPPVG
jgi:hypothetical protein